MTTAPCQHHPGEPAVGICVHCRCPLCDACITKVDGINHCHACLSVRSAAPSEHFSRAPSPGFERWGLGLGLGLLTVLVWIMLGALLPADGLP